jgi:hypothetical protein
MVGVHPTNFNSDGNGQEVTDTTALDDTLVCHIVQHFVARKLQLTPASWPDFIFIFLRFEMVRFHRHS